MHVYADTRSADLHSAWAAQATACCARNGGVGDNSLSTFYRASRAPLALTPSSGCPCPPCSDAMGFCCADRCYNTPHSWQLGWLAPQVLDAGNLGPGDTRSVTIAAQSRSKYSGLQINATTWLDGQNATVLFVSLRWALCGSYKRSRQVVRLDQKSMHPSAHCCQAHASRRCRTPSCLPACQCVMLWHGTEPVDAFRFNHRLSESGDSLLGPPYTGHVSVHNFTSSNNFTPQVRSTKVAAIAGAAGNAPRMLTAGLEGAVWQACLPPPPPLKPAAVLPAGNAG